MFDRSSRIRSLPLADGQAELDPSHDLVPVAAPVLTGVCCAAWGSSTGVGSEGF